MTVAQNCASCPELMFRGGELGNKAKSMDSVVGHSGIRYEYHQVWMSVQFFFQDPFRDVSPKRFHFSCVVTLPVFKMISPTKLQPCGKALEANQKHCAASWNWPATNLESYFVCWRILSDFMPPKSARNQFSCRLYPNRQLIFVWIPSVVLGSRFGLTPRKKTGICTKPAKIWREFHLVCGRSHRCCGDEVAGNYKYGMAWSATNTFKSLKGRKCFLHEGFSLIKINLF